MQYDAGRQSLLKAIMNLIWTSTTGDHEIIVSLAHMVVGVYRSHLAEMRNTLWVGIAYDEGVLLMMVHSIAHTTPLVCFSTCKRHFCVCVCVCVCIISNFLVTSFAFHDEFLLLIKEKIVMTCYFILKVHSLTTSAFGLAGFFPIVKKTLIPSRDVPGLSQDSLSEGCVCTTCEETRHLLLEIKLNASAARFCSPS